MPDLEPNQQSDFMIEKIKERPINKRRLLKRTLLTAAMAVIFGLIACFTFLVLEPVFSNWLHPEEKPQLVVFPEDQEEMSPEEMLADTIQQEHPITAETEPLTLEKKQIEEILKNVTLDLDNYDELYTTMSSYVEELRPCMVTITGITSNLDWLDNVQESKNQVVGVLVANNGKELLILADYQPIKNAEKLVVTFYNGTQVSAQMKAFDTITNLAVIAGNPGGLSQEFVDEKIKIAELGSSNYKKMEGIPVVALGRPMGLSNSIGYGMIASSSGQMMSVDANYKLLQTDIYGSQNGSGVLFNLHGQVIGIITNYQGNTNMDNMVIAYGISDLKKRVEKMSNGEKNVFLGIGGSSITREVHDELGVPYGAYISKIEMDSPAMLAGMQRGDIITMFDDRTIMTFEEYTNALMQNKVGQRVEITVNRQVQEEYKQITFQIELAELE